MKKASYVFDPEDGRRGSDHVTDGFIGFHRPSIGEEEITEVIETLRSGWLTTGPRADRFELQFSEYTGAPHAIAVNSATAGLHLALAGLEIGPSDEVITTPMTFCATVVFSFYATKNLTTGEGGMVTTHNPRLAERVRMLALHGLSHEVWDRYRDHGGSHYDVIGHGFKYNLSDIQAAIGIHQLRKLDHFIKRRALYAAIYNDAFAGMDELEIPPDDSRCRHAWHLYILRLNLPRLRIDREDFVRELRQKGIGTSIHFIPIPLLRFFARLPLPAHECPLACELYPRVLSLPLYPAMTEKQVRYVADSVQAIARSSSKAKFVA